MYGITEVPGTPSAARFSELIEDPSVTEEIGMTAVGPAEGPHSVSCPMEAGKGRTVLPDDVVISAHRPCDHLRQLQWTLLPCPKHGGSLSKGVHSQVSALSIRRSDDKAVMVVCDDGFHKGSKQPGSDQV